MILRFVTGTFIQFIFKKWIFTKDISNWIFQAGIEPIKIFQGKNSKKNWIKVFCLSFAHLLRSPRYKSYGRCLRHLRIYDNGEFVQNSSRVQAGINAGTNFFYSLMENLMLYNTSKFQVGGGLGSAIIVDLVTRGEILKFRLSKRPLGP